jgi:hypothetical protein
MKMLITPGVLFGADPELFITQGGKIIGSEKAIPEKGLNLTSRGVGSFGSHNKSGEKIVLDGVQIELHVNPSWCRAHLGNELRAHFTTLRNHLKTLKNTKVSFEAIVKVDPEELKSLSEKSRALGCAPSLNTYNPKATIKVNPATYTTRSAGGHLHFGFAHTFYGDNGIYIPGKVDHRARLVPIFDALIGNTSVMLDRDPLAAERRKVYGQAGEYRLPKYGIEYRTLSNFWLQSYQLMSLVMGLGRLSVAVLATSLSTKDGVGIDAEKALLKSVHLGKIRRAINKNDLELAKENWQGVRAFIEKYAVGKEESMAVGPKTLKEFDFFLKRVEERGLKYWFPKDPMEHWCNLPEGHYNGWESFLRGEVRSELKMAEATPAVRAEEAPCQTT